MNEKIDKKDDARHRTAITRKTVSVTESNTQGNSFGTIQRHLGNQRALHLFRAVFFRGTNTNDYYDVNQKNAAEVIGPLSDKSDPSVQRFSNRHIEPQINSIKNEGFPIPHGLRDYFEPRFGHDFSDVKIHTDAQSADTALALNAKTFPSGKDVVFGAGQYQPDQDAGKRLIAHELTHVVQQSGNIQRQPHSSTHPLPLIQITEETVDISEEFSGKESGVPQAEIISSGENNSRHPHDELVKTVQKKSGDLLINREENPPPATPVSPAPPPRVDLAFLMGSDNFYRAARKFFEQHHPEATIITLRDNSLSGIFQYLRDNISDQNPAGNLYIISHANVDGTLGFKLSKSDKDSHLTFGELSNALVKSPDHFNLSGGIDSQTKIHIKGCNIGRNEEILDAIDDAFGRKVTVDAPTHKQGYEYHTEVKGKAAKIVTSEYFKTYNVEYPGSVEKTPEELIADYGIKYSNLGLSDQDWEIAVLGTVKQGKRVDTDAAKRRAEVDKLLKEGLSALDKKSPDYKTEAKQLTDDAKAENAQISAEAKAAKETNAAKGSKGAVRSEVVPFKTSFKKPAPQPLTEKEILKAAPVLCAGAMKDKNLPKGIAAGIKFTSGSVKSERLKLYDVYKYTIIGKFKGVEYTFTIEKSVPAYPQSDDDAFELAELIITQYADKTPDFAVARRDMFDWSFTRQKNGTIVASLVMTIYKIDLELRTAAGDKVDPAAKTGDSDFYGESDID